MRKRFVGLIAAALVLLLGVGAYQIGRLYWSDARIYERNWNIEIPEEHLTEIYSAASEDNAMGDGLRYTVYEADAAALELLKDQPACDGFSVEELSRRFDALDVPARYRLPEEDPVSAVSLSKEDGSRLWILIYEAERKVCFFQSMM